MAKQQKDGQAQRRFLIDKTKEKYALSQTRKKQLDAELQHQNKERLAALLERQARASRHSPLMRGEMLPNTSPEQGKDLDNELQNEAEPGSAVREKLKVSQSQPYLQGRFSINQVRLDKLDKYNKASQDQIAQVPKLLKTFEQKVSRANQNKEMFLKSRFDNSGKKLNLQVAEAQERYAQ